MANRIWVRPIKPEESATFLDWSLENADKSEFDPAVPLYPSSSTWCAYDKTGPVAYQTIQQPIMITEPLMLESLAPRPGNTPSQNALAMKELTQTAITLAHCKGAGEIYFLSSDLETDKFAANHIFEKLPFTVYRVRLSDLSG